MTKRALAQQYGKRNALAVKSDKGAAYHATMKDNSDG